MNCLPPILPKQDWRLSLLGEKMRLTLTANDIARFWQKVDGGFGLWGGGESYCWEWTAARDKDGYGQFWLGGKPEKAHRIAFALHNGAIPEGLHICHSCDNPGCVRPSHLWAGTNADNHADKAAKGRARNGEIHGENHGAAKLDVERVKAIRAARANGESMRSIGFRFGVRHTQVGRIVRRENWARIP